MCGNIYVHHIVIDESLWLIESSYQVRDYIHSYAIKLYAMAAITLGRLWRNITLATLPSATTIRRYASGHSTYAAATCCRLPAAGLRDMMMLR